jgi:ribosome-associated toxin RatA of RatAB toxin-antitoxin module
MHTENRICIQADVATVYGLAAAVERWPALLPHYRWVRVLADDGQRRLVEMAARREAIPVWWCAEQVCDPSTPRITFRHVRGVTSGMAVEWAFEPGPAGVWVSIRHDLRLRWPLVGGVVADHIIGPLFVAHIAGKTLTCIKRLAEKAGCPPTEGARGAAPAARPSREGVPGRG